MSRDANKDIVRAFVAAINAQDGAQLDALVPPDFRRHSDAATSTLMSSIDPTCPVLFPPQHVMPLVDPLLRSVEFMA